jgi:hypothetical protein
MALFIKFYSNKLNHGVHFYQFLDLTFEETVYQPVVQSDLLLTVYFIR